MLSFETLVFPVMTMMGLAFLYSTILRTFRDTWASSVAFGGLFGLAIILAMSAPVRLGESFIFDLRGLFVGLSVIFGGWITGAIALACGLCYQVFAGGDGMEAGLVGLAIAFGIGAIWRLSVGRLSAQTWLSDALFGATISFSLLSIFILPAELAAPLLVEVAPKVILGNIVGAMGLGFVLRREARLVAYTEELRLYASVDPLTKLLNRHGAARELQALRDGVGCGRALFYFDLDHFKSINDQFGHAAGDAALAAVADRIRQCVRERVVFSRHGGDEFTLFIPDVPEESVSVIANRLRRSVSDVPVQFRGEAVALSISVGAYWTDTDATFEEMLHQADGALLRAKALGRNRISVASMGETTRPVAPHNWPAQAGAIH